jgi:hypothetical protein
LGPPYAGSLSLNLEVNFNLDFFFAVLTLPRLQKSEYMVTPGGLILSSFSTSGSKPSHVAKSARRQYPSSLPTDQRVAWL